MPNTHESYGKQASISQKGRIRQGFINNPRLDTDNIDLSGPINDVLSCGNTTAKFRKNYDKIQWDKD